MLGISGLNYPSVQSVIKLYAKKKKDRIRLFQEIRAIERGFLKATHEKRNKK